LLFWQIHGVCISADPRELELGKSSDFKSKENKQIKSSCSSCCCCFSETVFNGEKKFSDYSEALQMLNFIVYCFFGWAKGKLFLQEDIILIFCWTAAMQPPIYLSSFYWQQFPKLD
jgi:hypothetical protein